MIKNVKKAQLVRKVMAIALAAMLIVVCAVGCKPNETDVDQPSTSQTTSTTGDSTTSTDPWGETTDPSSDATLPTDAWEDPWVDPGSDYEEPFYPEDEDPGEEEPGEEDPGDEDPGEEEPDEPTTPSGPVVDTEGTLGFNVYDFGAIGDGVADDTNAFNNACELAARENGIVIVPDGTYRLTGTVALNGITMQGYSVKSWPADKDKLPTIIMDHRENGFMMYSAGLSGVHITRTHDVNRPVVRVNITGCRVSNVYISDVGAGIRFKDYNDEPKPGDNPGRSNIENILIEDCTRLGMYVSGTLDVPYVKNVQVISDKPAFAESGVGIKLTQNDDIRMSDCYVSGAYMGYQITDTNPFIEQALWGSLDNCSTENCTIGLKIESGPNMQDTLNAPVTFTGGTLNGTEAALMIGPSRVQYTFNGTTFHSTKGTAIQVSGGEGVLFTNCKVISDKASVTAFTATGCKSLVVSGCTLTSGGDGILLESSNTAAVVADSTITAKGTKVVNKMTANVVVK